MSKPVERDATSIEETKKESQGASSSQNKYSDASKYTNLDQIGKG